MGDKLRTLIFSTFISAYLNRKLSIRNLPPVQEKFLRVKVIADASVTNHYGTDKIQKYLMTVMNIVSILIPISSECVSV